MAGRIAQIEDCTLIERTLAGQTECFGVLVDRHRASIRRCIRSMVRDTSDEDDILQEVLLKAWRSLSKFRSESSFATWITQIAKNEVFQEHRRKCRSLLRPALRDLDAFVCQCESPHQFFERVETQRTVRNAIAGLPAKYKQILLLRELNELSGRETARWLRASIPLVKSRLFRARLMLSAALQRQHQPAARLLTNEKVGTGQRERRAI